MTPRNLPTLERARELGLSVVIDPPGLLRLPKEVLGRPATHVLRQAAIIVVGSLTRRTRVTKEQVMRKSAAQALPAAAQEPPLGTPIAACGLSLLVSMGGDDDFDGTQTALRVHDMCRGAGCNDCAQTGMVTFTPTANGGWVKARVRHVTEERSTFHIVYTPTALPTPFEERLQQLLGPPFVPPDESEWHGELARDAVGYRGSAQDPRVVSGFALAPAIDLALRFLDDACSGADESESRVFTWPLLRLFYEGLGQAVIFPTPAGSLEALGCAAEAD